MTASEVSKARLSFAENGFVLVPRAAPAKLLEACQSFVSSSDDWVSGDESAHSWQESEGQLPSGICALLPLSLFKEVADASIMRHVAWINVFGRGEFIPAHKDAGGDVQLLICLEAPDEENGGHLWLDTPERLVLMEAGDALLFRASQIRHGTTPVSPLQTKRRVTLNVRAWAKPDVTRQRNTL